MNDSVVIDFPAADFNTSYKCCILWTPLRPTSWFFPFIGHIGISNSKGVVFDFIDSNIVGINNLNKPTRFIQLDLKKIENFEAKLDNAIENNRVKFGAKKFNIFWENCLTFVGCCLNELNYFEITLNMFSVLIWINLYGKYSSYMAIFETIVPFTIFLLAIVLIFSLFL